MEGDSASVSVATAIISAITKSPVRQDVAMTGSLSVRGDVLPVGGINPKIEAAVEAGANAIILPKENAKDIVTEAASKVKIIPVATLEEVIEAALDGNSKKVLAKLKRKIKKKV